MQGVSPSTLWRPGKFHHIEPHSSIVTPIPDALGSEAQAPRRKIALASNLSQDLPPHPSIIPPPIPRKVCVPAAAGASNPANSERRARDGLATWASVVSVAANGGRWTGRQPLTHPNVWARSPRTAAVSNAGWGESKVTSSIGGSGGFTQTCEWNKKRWNRARRTPWPRWWKLRRFLQELRGRA